MKILLKVLAIALILGALAYAEFTATIKYIEWCRNIYFQMGTIVFFTLAFISQGFIAAKTFWGDEPIPYQGPYDYHEV